MVVVKIDSCFDVDVLCELFFKIVGLECLGEVNLEKVLCLVDYIGGYFVLGYVDGFGMVMYFVLVNELYELCVWALVELGKYFVYKGFVVVNGVLLMVNIVCDDVDGCEFLINLILYMVVVIMFKYLKVGS